LLASHADRPYFAPAMSKSSARSLIRLRGVRHNNLKNFDLDLPLNQLIVITGLSGSGKSSLAFDTLFAEGQRRYIETFSPYARQFFDRMDKPQVDSIEGIPPAIAIEQRNSVKTTRSTVGTMTEICDHLKLLWPHVAQLHCRQCGQLVRKNSPQQIWETLQSPLSSKIVLQSGRGERERSRLGETEILITFDLPISEKLSLADSLALISKQGYQRLLHNNQIVRLDSVTSEIPSMAPGHFLTVIQDRLKLAPANRARFVEACEQAYHFGKGKLTIRGLAGDLTAQSLDGLTLKFSNRFHCADCDLEYREPSPALFSFNHPVGACPICKGFGRTISIDYDLAVPDRSRTLAEGVVKPWLTGQGAESQTDLLRACRRHHVPTDVPFEKLSKKWQDFVIEGEPGYGRDEKHEWPRAWYGVKGYFRWLESKAYKMHVRVLLSRYRAYTICPACRGARFQPESLLYTLPVADRRSEMTLADFYQLPLRDAVRLIESLAEQRSGEPALRANDPVTLVLNAIRSRLRFLNDVGLGYLTLDRPTRSLSGGETERVNLTTCLGTRLVNTLFVLDEPSVGLHPRDTERLVRILHQLRDAGNTVVVVEHEASVMRAANQLIDIGPGHGATGGHIVFQGTYAEILRSKKSLTGNYLGGLKEIEVPQRRPVTRSSHLSHSSQERGPVSRSTARPRSPTALELNESLRAFGNPQSAPPALKLTHATRHNLDNVSVEIPLGRFVAITGVSGSGKTTLVREVLLPTLETGLKTRISNLKFSSIKASERIEDPGAEETNAPDSEAPSATGDAQSTILEGAENLSRVVLVDQSILGKTPRSNPAVYIGAFDDIRDVFAQSEPAKRRGLNASAFSFNSAQGQCERCRGAGFEKIEMQFLSDVFIRCPDCGGRRYRQHILEIKVSRETTASGAESQASETKSSGAKSPVPARSTSGILTPAPGLSAAWSIADTLEATADEAIEFMSGFSDSKPARRAVQALKLLQEVGLGYLRLGQPINTLSGGESQRLKLVRHLAEAAPTPIGVHLGRTASNSLKNQSRLALDATLFLFDEPTTGLHFDDVRILLKVFQRLVDAGHSVIVIEHNLDVIKSADWVIDLGPEAGDEGGRIVAQGTPEEVADCTESHTGQALKCVLNQEPIINLNEKNSRHRPARGRSRPAR
jgi:excinuclease ABC subunit A